MVKRILALSFIMTSLAWGPGCGTQRVIQTGKLAENLSATDCQSCHGINNTSDGHTDGIKPIYDADASWIATHKDMQTFTGQLSDIEKNEIIEYVKSLKKQGPQGGGGDDGGDILREEWSVND